MKLLQKVKCPICHSEMVEDKILTSKVNQTGKKPSARNYCDCIRKCFNCEIGASNSENSYTFIYKDFHKNIPSTFLGNLDKTLDESINLKNRSNKKIKIGFSSSEDAVSWIFINFFIQKNKLDLLQEVLNLDSKILEIFMWGVPQLGYIKNNNKLKEICENLGEDKRLFTEPDIILVNEKDVLFIEVKVKSGNETKDPSKKDFDKYLENEFYIDKRLAKESRYYELIRNWTISHYFSSNKPAKLINLAPMRLFAKSHNLDIFEKSLNTPKNFIQLAWEDVIERLDNKKNENNICYDLIVELKKRIFQG